jgi:phosphoglycolate phosphatase-like HAD superfamily hydrolase
MASHAQGPGTSPPERAPSIVPLRELRGVIWDCNGVLADDEPVHQAAFTTVVGDSTGLDLPGEVYADCCFHRTDGDGVARLLARGLLVGDPEELVRAKQNAYYAQLPDPNAVVVPGARRTLQLLADAGIAMVMVTASVPAWTDWFLTGTGLDAFLPASAVTAGAYGTARFDAIATHADRWPTGTGLLIDDADDHLVRGAEFGLRCLSVRTDGSRSAVAATVPDLDALADAWERDSGGA